MTSVAAAAPATGDRRARRRQETIEEIVTIAETLMNTEGVNGMSLSEIARRLGVKPPSIYKYFDSIAAIYDALFARGQQEHLAVMQAAMADADPGLPALMAGLDASGRWCVAHPGLTQLMFWRPVPGFEPTPEAMAPSIEMVQIQRRALADAVANGQLGPGATSDDAIYLTSTLISGGISQSLANEPNVAWGQGRFSSQLQALPAVLAAVYPPRHRRTRRQGSP
ncbi:MAG TPA: TetR/AcrR family transcriptional regulator [Mycobacteriales bacterium]|jgi:AcrR family transcriptional regulator|nr:TetR/AcrR family transcriptional regulator [Mycobacteriales bacterium]